MDGPETAEPPSAEPARPSCSQDPCARVSVDDPGGLLVPADVPWLQDRLRAAVDQLGLAGEVRIRPVADTEMMREHDRALGDPSTTDVLTFDLREDPSGPLDTDVLICVDEAARQSARLGHPVREELLLYAIHAVLHCTGYDDHDEADARAMHAREDEILEAIGVGPRYAETRR